MAAILIATLTPNFAPTALSDPRFCILCGERGAADFLSNVVLFAPLGAVLALRGRRLLPTLAAGGGLSLFVELAQFSFVPGRDANPGDLLANTLGAGFGWLVLVGLWIRLPRVSAGLRGFAGVAAALAALVVAIGGVMLFRPAVPDGALYLQWTAQFGNMTHYEGRVLSTHIGGRPFEGPGRFADPRGIAEYLARGGSLQADVLAGPAPVGLAPIVSIFDDAQREVWLLGADGDAVALRRRTRGRELRLDAPELRFDAPSLARPGARVRLEIAADGTGGCLRVDGRRTCRRGPGAGDTWSLLRGTSWWDSAAGAAVGAAWMLVLFLPAGALVRNGRMRIALAGVCCGVLAVLPPLLGMPATRPVAIIAAAMGIGAGALLHRCRTVSAAGALHDGDAPSLLVVR